MDKCKYIMYIQKNNERSELGTCRLVCCLSRITNKLVAEHNCTSQQGAYTRHSYTTINKDYRKKGWSTRRFTWSLVECKYLNLRGSKPKNYIAYHFPLSECNKLHKYSDSIKKDQWKSHVLSSVYEANHLSFEGVCSMHASSVSEAPSSGIKKTVFIQYCQSISYKQDTLKKWPQPHACKIRRDHSRTSVTTKGAHETVLFNPLNFVSKSSL